MIAKEKDLQKAFGTLDLPEHSGPQDAAVGLGTQWVDITSEYQHKLCANLGISDQNRNFQGF